MLLTNIYVLIKFGGRMAGVYHDRWAKQNDVFVKYFQPGALALGGQGDTFDTLHWRVRNGEVPTDLNPKIWWIHIGGNNMKFGCDPNAITVGIMRIVEEIRSRKPNAIIVVNALLPPNDLNDDKWDKMNKVNNGLKRSIDEVNDGNVYNFSAFRVFYDTSIHNVRRNLHFGSVHLNSNCYELWAKQFVKWTTEKLDIDLSE